MSGGLLQLEVNADSKDLKKYFIGNPKINFFKTTFRQYSDFSRQKFKIYPEGNKDLNQTSSTIFQFKISRYADLLSDTYLSITLPEIYSPIFYNSNNNTFSSFEFKWIKDIGSTIIKNITIKIGSQIIQEYSGYYIKNIVSRDYDSNKKEVFNEMTGNTPEFYDPASTTENKKYPNTDGLNSIPSIICKQLYIPINSWFSSSSFLALPLVALQYHEVTIDIELRPLHELYVILDVNNNDYNNNLNTLSHIAPPTTIPIYYLKNFIKPTERYVTENILSNNINNLNSFNIHLLCRQIFLPDDIRCYFAKESLNYTIIDIREFNYYDLVARNKIDIISNGLIRNWMWFFQRSDAKLTNDWTNFTNVLSNEYPNRLTQAYLSNIYIRGNNTVNYEKNIMKNFSIYLNGEIRENLLNYNIFEFIDQFNDNKGSGYSGLYIYNFSIKNDNSCQISGLLDTNNSRIDFEFTLNSPPQKEEINIGVECDEAGNIISYKKNNIDLYKYVYNLILIEEKVNILTIENGMAGMKLNKF